ncbi:MAG: dephospho-CoA kinase, partial [Candidatus Margulisiibacteriota bacterium]
KEIGLAKYCGQIWLVASSRANRIKRLLSKGFDRKEILARIASQRSLAGYKKEADLIIKNNGSKSALAKKVERYLE